MARKKAIFNWSGGKDSSFALFKIIEKDEYEIVTLLTTLSEKHKRISMHGVREDLLDEQAETIGLPLKKIYLPENTSMKIYNQIFSAVLNELKAEGVTHSIFGDIFLEDLKKYREKQLETVGLKGVFPLWKEDTKKLAHEYIELGFKTIITAVDASKLDRSCVLNVFDHHFLSNLPKEVDPCGENGEFHSFVYDGPIFKNNIDVVKGDIVTETYKNDGNEFKFYFGDLILK